jgi:hypothetical protein
MYPKTFINDPVQVARARLVTLQNPNLDILPPENLDEMPGIAHFLEGGFKARDQEGRLLLPDLSALANSTIGIFSDYGGDNGQYLTYSFLVCGFGSLGAFQEQMAKVRRDSDLGTNEIAFKDFGFGPLFRMVPEYLRTFDAFVPGMLFTLAVDKSIPSLFGPPEATERLQLAFQENGLGTVKRHVAERLFRITHIAAFLVALLGHEGQKLFWMTDHDSIAATPEGHRNLLAALDRVLPLYTTKRLSLIGGARPFPERTFSYLDLLSAPDIAAGAIAQVLSGFDAVGHDKVQIKEGGDHALRWLCHDSVTLKKLCLVVKRDAAGGIVSGPVNFEAKQPVEGELFIPIQLMR